MSLTKHKNKIVYEKVLAVKSIHNSKASLKKVLKLQIKFREFDYLTWYSISFLCYSKRKSFSCYLNLILFLCYLLLCYLVPNPYKCITIYHWYELKRTKCNRTRRGVFTCIAYIY